MKMKNIVISMSFFSLSCTTFGQTKYSLDKCLEMARENNKKIINSKLFIRSSVEEEKNVLTSFFPQVNAMGTRFRAKDPFISIDMNGGLSYSFLKKGTIGSVTLTQPIFAGGKIINSYKLAKLGVEVGEQKARLSENEVVLQTENDYWKLVSLGEKMQTLNIIDEQLMVLRKDVEAALDAGMVTNNDVLRVKLRQNEIKSHKIDMENGIKLLKMSLCHQIGLSITSSDSFDIITPDIMTPASPVEYYVDHKAALFNRPENKLLEKTVDAAKLQTKMKIGEYMPTLAVGAIYNQNNLMDKWDGNSAVFMSVSVPLSGWWGGTHEIRKQKLEEQIARNQLLEGQDMLLIQMESVKNELNNQYEQLLVAKESIEQARENLRLNNDSYKVGIVTIADVLDAQTLLQQSRDKYVEAYSTFEKKIAEYLQVTGR